MARPTSKTDLMAAAQTGFEKLMDTVDSFTAKEHAVPFCFVPKEKYKAAHWERDRNLRDVLVHLYEWHQLLLNWIKANTSGDERPFLPAPYNWKTYGEMNLVFWEKHQDTPLEQAEAMLRESHRQVLAVIASFSNEMLFSKGLLTWTGTTTLGSYCVSATSSHYDWANQKLKTHIKNCKTQ